MNNTEENQEPLDSLPNSDFDAHVALATTAILDEFGKTKNNSESQPEVQPQTLAQTYKLKYLKAKEQYYLIKK